MPEEDHAYINDVCVSNSTLACTVSNIQTPFGVPLYKNTSGNGDAIPFSSTVRGEMFSEREVYFYI